MDFLARISRFEAVSIATVLVLLSGYLFVFSAPDNFAPGTIVRIAKGASVPQTAQELADAHIISHPTFLRAVLRLSGKSGSLQTGVYKFIEPENMLAVAYRLVTGDYGLAPVRLTFVEGTTIRESANLIASTLPGSSSADFLTAAKGQEGYLFPDTYFFQPSADAASIVATMHATFEVKMRSVDLGTRPLGDVVTMASLIEKEARTPTDRRIVAGILWNRIKLGMPLQVDAVFGYIFNRATYSPSPADLRVDSPYNTYLHKGLPPGPIDNPGQDALLAAANPTKTTYLYYLTGNDGLMHYATTYAGHQANLRNYLQ